MVAALIVLGILQLGIFFMLLKRREPQSDSVDKLSSRLDANQKLMVDSLQKQSAESNRIVADMTKQLTQIRESNKQVISTTDELKVLKDTLLNPKQRGVLGEYYLESVLENIMPPKNYELQYRFKDGAIVDAAIILDKKKILPVDSKFSLENYNRMVKEKNKDKYNDYVKSFKADLKKRIDETAKYIRPQEGTLDYAFMFIPSEAIYYDLLSGKVDSTGVNTRDLIDYAFIDKKVIIVSPTTFAAYLQTVLQGLRSLQIEEKAKEIQTGVGKLGRHIASYEDNMIRLGKSLSTTVNHYNSAHKELGKVDKDISKIAGVDSGVDPLELDRPSVED